MAEGNKYGVVAGTKAALQQRSEQQIGADQILGFSRSFCEMLLRILGNTQPTETWFNDTNGFALALAAEKEDRFSSILPKREICTALKYLAEQLKQNSPVDSGIFDLSEARILIETAKKFLMSSEPLVPIASNEAFERFCMADITAIISEVRDPQAAGGEILSLLKHKYNFVPR